MAPTSCWTCVLRPSSASPLLATAIHKSASRGATSLRTFTSTTNLRPTTTTTPSNPKQYQNAPFSTTVAPSAAAPMKRDKYAQNARGVKKLKIKKKGGAAVTRSRPPAPGERKAIRKRIVLSNNNAIEVVGMEDMTVESVSDEARVGQVMGLPAPVIDQLRAAEAFKITQAWPMFRRPGMLVRRESVELARVMEEVEGKKGFVSRVVLGEKGAGKSMLLLQGMVAAFLRNWVVVNVPNAVELINGNHDYQPLPSANKASLPTAYTQKAYTSLLLSQIATSNSTILNNLTTTQKLKAPLPQTSITLHRLASVGVNEPDVAPAAFDALWSELIAPGRPPILLTIDGIAHLCTPKTQYRAPDFSLIHPHSFTLIKLLSDCVSGLQAFPNGGVVLSATSHNDPHSHAFDLAIKNKEEALAGKPLTPRDPWTELDEPIFEALSKEAVKLQRLEGLTRNEARGLMEYWAKSGVLRSRVDERTVAERWSLAGKGVVGEMEREALHMHI